MMPHGSDPGTTCTTPPPTGALPAAPSSPKAPSAQQGASRAGGGTPEPLLQSIVESQDTAAGRMFDFIIQGLIVLSLICFSIETLPDLPQETVRFLHRVETVTVLLFSAEYVLRVYVARRKLRFLLSFLGLVDLLAILPFYLTTGVDLRSVRALRFLRLIRVLKLVRYSRAMRRLQHAFVAVRDELALFFFGILILLFLAAVGIYYFEHEAQPAAFGSVFHSLWWSLATVTTVGYGDVHPITLGGKIFTGLVLLLGLCVVAVPSALLASGLATVQAGDRPPACLPDAADR